MNCGQTALYWPCRAELEFEFGLVLTHMKTEVSEAAFAGSGKSKSPRGRRNTKSAPEANEPPHVPPASIQTQEPAGVIYGVMEPFFDLALARLPPAERNWSSRLRLGRKLVEWLDAIGLGLAARLEFEVYPPEFEGVLRWAPPNPPARRPAPTDGSRERISSADTNISFSPYLKNKYKI